MLSTHSTRALPLSLGLVLTLVFASSVSESIAQRRRSRPQPVAVCGDPTVRCRTSAQFQPYDLPFRLPTHSIIFETEPFYAVILKSVSVAADNCTTFISEEERQSVQAMFPRHKVFASRCFEAPELYYTNVAPEQRFMAVYAGRTRAEADQMLSRVRATGRFPGANLRRMKAGFNGT